MNNEIIFTLEKKKDEFFNMVKSCDICYKLNILKIFKYWKDLSGAVDMQNKIRISNISFSFTRSVLPKGTLNI